MVSQGATSRKYRSARPWIEVLCVPIITANPSLDGLSPKGSKPLLSNGRVVELAPIRREELSASELVSFLSSVAFRDQQLRSSAHFNPWPRHKVTTH
ncbi:hypothetical protein PIB30_069660 [Stylosanthes scabra]|uniref:Uncharacterized protein n=1 Tax=Stylosanthes scabra TaxID=79078 RepID=A0ABU6ZLX9_9FABA|nr:hypothetical protein [Stylosanthes scabra]